MFHLNIRLHTQKVFVMSKSVQISVFSFLSKMLQKTIRKPKLSFFVTFLRYFPGDVKTKIALLYWNCRFLQYSVDFFIFTKDISINLVRELSFLLRVQRRVQDTQHFEKTITSLQFHLQAVNYFRKILHLMCLTGFKYIPIG